MPSHLSILLPWCSAMRMAEKLRSHSQDVTGRVARILRATLMFAKESKLIALSVDATLLGA